jgi:hypothetical protein
MQESDRQCCTTLMKMFHEEISPYLEAELEWQKLFNPRGTEIWTALTDRQKHGESWDEDFELKAIFNALTHSWAPGEILNVAKKEKLSEAFENTPPPIDALIAIYAENPWLKTRIDRGQRYIVDQCREIGCKSHQESKPQKFHGEVNEEKFINEPQVHQKKRKRRHPKPPAADC